LLVVERVCAVCVCVCVCACACVSLFVVCVLVDLRPSCVVKCLWGVFVWGFGVLFSSCVCVGVGGVVLCRCVCWLTSDLLFRYKSPLCVCVCPCLCLSVCCVCWLNCNLALTRYSFSSRPAYKNQYYYSQTPPLFGHPPAPSSPTPLRNTVFPSDHPLLQYMPSHIGNGNIV